MRFFALWLPAVFWFSGVSTFASSGYFIDLEGEPIQNDYFNPEWLLLNTHDNSFLILDDYSKRLLQFDSFGQWRGAISEEGYAIANFSVIPREGLYVLVLQTKGKLEFHIRLYDLDMKPVGKARYGEGSLQVPNYFRQLLVVEDQAAKSGYRLFVNRWQPNFAKLRYPKMLQEVILENKGPGDWSLRDIGEPFDLQMEESAGFASQFKLRWLVKDEENERLLSLDQLQQRIWPYSMERSGLQMKNPLSLSLKRRVLPDRYFDRDAERAWQKSRQVGENVDPNEFFRIWHSSFTQVTGFHRLGTGYVVSYNIPNETFPQFAKEGEKTDKDAPLWRLCVQRLDRNLELNGRHLELPGAYFVGAANDVVYVFHPPASNSGTPRVEVLFGYHFEDENRGVKNPNRR